LTKSARQFEISPVEELDKSRSTDKHHKGPRVFEMPRRPMENLPAKQDAEPLRGRDRGRPRPRADAGAGATTADAENDVAVAAASPAGATIATSAGEITEDKQANHIRTLKGTLC